MIPCYPSAASGQDVYPGTGAGSLDSQVNPLMWRLCDRSFPLSLPVSFPVSLSLSYHLTLSDESRGLSGFYLCCNVVLFVSLFLAAALRGAEGRRQGRSYKQVLQKGDDGTDGETKNGILSCAFIDNYTPPVLIIDSENRNKKVREKSVNKNTLICCTEICKKRGAEKTSVSLLPTTLCFSLLRRHTRLDDIIIPIHILPPTATTTIPSPPLPPLPIPTPLGVLQLLHSRPLRLPNPLLQQHHRLLIHRKQLKLFPYHALYPLQQLDVVLRDERDGFSGPACARCAADAVDVVF